MTATDPGEGSFLVIWLIAGFIALGAGLAYAMLRNRRAEKRRDAERERTADRSAPP